MGGSGGGEEDPPPGETEEADREAQEIQSPPPPGQAVPVHQGLGPELLHGEPDGREAGRVKDGQEAEPGGEEQEALPAP